MIINMTDAMVVINELDSKIKLLEAEKKQAGASLDEYNRLYSDALLRISELEAELAAHKENEGDECPVCVLEAKNEDLMKLAGEYIRAYEDLAFGDATKEGSE